ncbi:High affinity nerve growth factor receptor [Paramuricea clavata]|uniref:High affinity nerve growth factor receptor, partial n=1 Tax=Paramuricea clavata TaxID=317549 RepID=A0A7D9JCI6_PARCT|nr:High affinity nerve growth factor receptor [Paramuricea clavata]
MDDICRGTPVYMAPEIHTRQLTNASQDGLKMADIWYLGILAYAMINPNLNTLYRKESESLGVAFNLDIMKHFMQEQILPDHDAKYEVLESTLFHDDALTPVFSWNKKAYTAERLVHILLDKQESGRLCVMTPINIAHNVTFLINNTKMKMEEDVKCDDMEKVLNKRGIFTTVSVIDRSHYGAKGEKSDVTRNLIGITRNLRHFAAAIH